MSVTVNQWILPISKARCGKKLRRFAGITIHETANTAATANAKSHAVYMNVNGGKNKEVSYHYVVDDKEAYHLVPDDEVAWHAGDGAGGKGNNETIAIEICVNAGGDFARAVDNAAALSAALLHERGIKTVGGYLFEHHDFSSFRKNCPANLRAGKAGGIAALRSNAQQALNVLWGGNQSEEEKQPEASGLYCVQTGAFGSKEAADRYAEVLKKAGFVCFVTKK